MLYSFVPVRFLEHELQPCNVEDVEHYYTRQDM